MEKRNGKNIIVRLETLSIMSFLLLVSFTPLIGAESKINSLYVERELIIERADSSGVDFSFYFGDFTVETIEKNEQTFEKLRVQNGGHTSEYGKAELPTVSFYVAVPQEAKVNLNYETEDFNILHQQVDIYPAQPPKPETQGYIDPQFTYDEEFYSKNEAYPSNVVEISSIIEIRGCKIARITVYPIAYNPVKKEITAYEKIHVEVDFIGGTGKFIPERLRSVYFQPLFDAFLINGNSIEKATMKNNPYSMGKLSKGDRADLLVVVYDDFYDEILPLAEWRHLSGLETKVVKWSEIGTTAAELRAYMSNAYHNWELPPSFLLIVGDADHVPVNYLNIHPYDGQYTGTDHWYVAFNASSYFPDMHEGRISVDNAAELTTVVNKILDYSKTPYMGDDWFNNVLLASYEEYGRYFVWGSETVYDFLNPLGYNVIRQYEGGTPPGSTQGVIDAIDNGVIIANHRDHGASQNDGYSTYTGWCHPKFTNENIINDIDNGAKYPIMFSLNCESGWFDGETDHHSGLDYESIGEAGLRVANKGFVATIAHTRVSWSGYNDEIGRGHYDAIFPDFDPDYPNGGSVNPYETAVFKMSQVMNYAKFWVYDKYIAPGGCPPYPWSPSESASRTTFEMLHVIGDPTMEVWTAMPQTMTVSHPNTLPGGPSVFEVTVTDSGDPIEGALVCLSQENGVYVKGFTDESGTVELEIDDVSDEDASLVVTAHNYLYYSSQIPVYINTPPDIPGSPSGPAVGKPGSTYLYTASTTDVDEDRILYNFSWGDGTYSDWVGPFDSGSPATASHAWNEKGTYEIKVKAKDTHGEETDWSDPMEVRMPRIFTIWDIIEMNFPRIYSILSMILGI